MKGNRQRDTFRSDEPGAKVLGHRQEFLTQTLNDENTTFFQWYINEGGRGTRAPSPEGEFFLPVEPRTHCMSVLAGPVVSDLRLCCTCEGGWTWPRGPIKLRGDLRPRWGFVPGCHREGPGWIQPGPALSQLWGNSARALLPRNGRNGTRSEDLLPWKSATTEKTITIFSRHN